jgi:hypothetical protein
MRKFTYVATAMFLTSIIIVFAATIIALYITSLQWFLIRHFIFRMLDFGVLAALLYPFAKGVIRIGQILFFKEEQNTSYTFGGGDSKKSTHSVELELT